MKRRQFIQAAGAGLAVGAVAKPAIAQSSPEVRWRLTSAFPKSLDTIFGAAETFSKYVSEATDGKFQVQPFAAGEIVGTFQAADAVGNGTVEMAHTASYYYVGKDPTFALGTAVPFGLNSRQMNAWLYQGGGNELLNEFYAKHNIYGLPGGNTGARWAAGSARRSRPSPTFRAQDAHRRLRRAGAAEARRCAAADRRRRHLSGPRARHDRCRRMGRPLRRREARLQQGRPVLLLSGLLGRRSDPAPLRQLQKWNELPKQYKAIATAAAGYANIDMQAKYDAQNPAALRRLVRGGTQLRPFPQEVLEASYKASNEVYDELGHEEPRLQEGLRVLQALPRTRSILWFQVAEYTFDNFMIRARARG